ncbi:outer membrane lipase/esterase [Luteibacter rhizovicinus]|uniref:Outer membrane lipase/esterase n=1 Tax=Luteibacter rhizovicinus TaxID=242606 RepID=A0A4R3YNI5_9GAMM|nr:autotransporter domain-containing protein [Luteibacter rhizovicinus]TCV92433.1 outer membrane lipase/esterase [Luteibacter rhizovicinus]
MRISHLAGAISVALLFSAGAAATDFQQVVSFGDSLSDSGNVAYLSGSPVAARFTTNPGTVAVENIATYFNLSLTPSIKGGTDYAYGGARVSVNNPVPSATAQVQGYLAANGGKANPNALYTMWIGANDLLAATNPATAQVAIATAATQEVGAIKALQAAGAKTIVVFNLPDVGKTPAAMAGGAAFASAASQGAQLYNGILTGGLAQMDRGIVPIDTYSLLNEVIANPSKYGFKNVTTPACTTQSSLTCTPNTLVEAGANNSYLFADGIHPTTAAHALLSQYAVSIITAPQKISLLGESALASNAAHTRTLRNQMLADNFGGETRVFAAVDYGQQKFKAGANSPKTDSDNVNLTVGADVRASDNVSAGIALGIAQNNADFSGGGGYKMQDIAASGYVLYHNGGGYVGGYGSFGQLSFTNIDRTFDLGTARRTETGKTDGSHVGAALTGGWWFGGETLKTGPFATVEWQNIRVSGYNEYSNDSSAMVFGKQRRNSQIATLGWRLQGNWQAGSTLLHPFAEVAWNHDSKADPRLVEAGLTSMNGRFALEGFSPDKTWGTADLGLFADFDKAWSGWVSYSGRFSDNSQKYNGLNLGVKLAF